MNEGNESIYIIMSSNNIPDPAPLCSQKAGPKSSSSPPADGLLVLIYKGERKKKETMS